MPQTFRQPDILDVARREGRVTVDGLAARFEVTVQTIRRDLTEMAAAGLLERVHGGAVLHSGVRNIGYEDRRELNAGAKASIGRRCAGMVANGSSLFVNIGTTAEAVARALLHHEALLVVTNNLNVANILAGNPDCEVVVAGGALRRADGGLTGHLTMRVIEQFRLDLAVIGCSALDEGGDVLDFDVSEVSVSQTILAHARRSLLVADGSKFHHAAPARITTLERLDCLVTDAPPPGRLAARCRDWGTAVEVAGGEVF
ncbi:MAG: DeoR/GlpR transcriptional regulator [Rhodobacteraceae bacterium]|nr:DeoR/GlpR transcriptional regulator [Paracoccaceae bacterium]